MLSPLTTPWYRILKACNAMSDIRGPSFDWEQVYNHNDVIAWEHFPHYWSFVRGIHWWLVGVGQSVSALSRPSHTNSFTVIWREHISSLVRYTSVVQVWVCNSLSVPCHHPPQTDPFTIICKEHINSSPQYTGCHVSVNVEQSMSVWSPPSPYWSIPHYL